MISWLKIKTKNIYKTYSLSISVRALKYQGRPKNMMFQADIADYGIGVN